MLLRSTKKFFQKTLDSVKSFLSAGGYQRLPKSPDPRNPGGGGGILELKYSTQSFRELDKVIIKSSSSSCCRNKDASSTSTTPPPRVHHAKASDHHDPQKKKKKNRRTITYEGKRYQNLWASDDQGGVMMREERGVSVIKKLKELEMMDKMNAEHVLDIEEILHYYSRLTCPAYLDIVENFFMDMYSELLSAAQTSSRVISSQWPPAAPKFYESRSYIL